MSNLLQMFKFDDIITKNDFNELSGALVWHSVTPECTQHDNDDDHDHHDHHDHKSPSYF